VAIIVSRWRMLLAFAALGSAGAFAYRGDWTPLAAAAALALLCAGRWVAGEMAATRAMLREQPAAGRHRKPLMRAYTCSRCGKPGVTEWAGEEEAARGRMLGLDLVCDSCLTAKLRAVAAPRM
jgi:hypothetical protein